VAGQVIAEIGSTAAIIVALISFAGSVAAVVISGRVKRRLDAEARVQNARIDYEYEAKKRLYEQCSAAPPPARP